MRVPKANKQSHAWHHVALFAGLGLFALWSLSLFDTPRLSPGNVALVGDHGDVPAHLVDVVQHTTSQKRLLLSTHNRLFWYYPETDQDMPLHSGQGVYYGAFPGDDDKNGSPTVWVVSRPHNWRPQRVEEKLLNINLESGHLISEVTIPSRFSHDAIRRDGTVFVCNTGKGSILQLSYPSMSVVNELQLFTLQEHVNTVAAYDDSSVWAVLHNLGKSQVVQVDLSSGQVVKRLRDVGNNSHGLVAWQGKFVMLSSKETSLIIMDPEDGSIQYAWWAPQGFLKGLMVLDDIAYFGISPPMQRQDRDGPKVMCDLVAVDLISKKQVFRRSLQTHGLLNVISAPHLSEASTYIAVSTGSPSTSGSIKSTLPSLQSTGLVQKQVQQTQQLSQGVIESVHWSHAWMTQALDEGAVDGEWPSSMPRLNMEVKQRALKKKQRTLQVPEPPTYVHLGKAPPALIEPVKGALATMPVEWWDPDVQATVSAVIADREKNLNAIKPGVQTMFLIFSSRTYDRIWELPLYTSYFKKTLEPLIEALIGRDAMSNIIRLQLARMTPGAHIKGHRDTGPWASDSHRIHVVLKTNPSISFFSCPQCNEGRRDQPPECQPPPTGTCIPLDTSLNSVFEVNNLILHEVTNTATEDRIHLVMDVLEGEAPERLQLQPGQRCHYISSTSQGNTPGC
eukprot:jgi/Ulvmu1/3200/UM015_0241.1